MRPSDILFPRPEGLWCAPGRFFIDPLRPVDKALVTHGHSDHARAGHGAVLASADTLAIMEVRYGRDFAGSRQCAAMGEPIRILDATVTFFPAGHVLGSAQIAIEASGTRFVVSGDYKRRPDPTAAPFEPVPCDVFITEATFGLPVFRHPDAVGEIGKLLASRARFSEQAHLVGAYSLGKAQRIIALLRSAGYDRPVFLHGAMETLTRLYEARGTALGETPRLEPGARASLAGEIIICPPSALKDRWARRFADPVTIAASGWMRIRARARQQGVELPLVISDHADWPELTATIVETGAAEVWVTHGQEDALVHWCQTRGISARPLRLVGYGDETDDAALPSAAEQP